MFTTKMRPVLLSLVALLIIGGLTIAVSPTVRAGLLSLFTLNGVEVSMNEDTGELVVEGDPDAILYDDGETVMIDGGDESIVYVDSEMAKPDLLSVDDLAEFYPDFVVPTDLPDGYEIIPMVFLDPHDDSVGVGWQHGAGNQITYQWDMDRDAYPTPSPTVAAAAAEAGVDVTKEHEYGFFEKADMLILNDVTEDGIEYLIIASDVTLTEADLRALLP